MLYKYLDQKSPAYERALWDELDDLYRGGYHMATSAPKYMPKIIGENEHRYKDRLKSAGYINYIGQIIDYFAASLFSQDLTITEAADADDPTTPGNKSDSDYYSEFAHNADLKGTSFSKLLKQVFTTAILKKRALIYLDLPSVTDDLYINNRAEEDALGLARCYAGECPIEQLIDWEYDDGEEGGCFSWAILHRHIIRRNSPEEARGTVQHVWKVWRMDGELARWEKYSIEKRLDEKLRDEDEIPLVAEGLTSFRRIPLVELVVPEGLWIGNKLGCLAKEHFQRRSSLIAAENKSLVAIPVAKLGPEISGIGDPLPSEAQQNPNRGIDPVGRFLAQGFSVIGKDDSIEYVEPLGTAYALIDSQLQQLKDEMFRVVHQMAASVDNSANTTRRSGSSKKEDRAAESIVLSAFGSLVRDFSKEIYDTIADARGEDVVWTPHGLDNYDVVERDEVLKEALAVDMVNIPSKTFKTGYKTRLAFKLEPNLPPETQAVIRQEIEDGIKEQEKLKLEQHKNALELAKQGPPELNENTNDNSNGTFPA